LEQNQDKKDQLQPQEIPSAEVKENSENKISEQSTTVPDTKEETPPTPQPEIQNTELQTDQMEVHKHPHHVMHKKKWSEYLLEFFMLFLAVFLGFLAENQREHLVERRQEKGFVSSLLNDLRLDTGWFNTVNRSASRRILHVDSAILFLSGPEKNEIPVTVYQHLLHSIEQVAFIPYSGTITQLKNAGGLRLIKNRAAVDSIEDYDRLMERLEIRRNVTDQLTRNFTEALNKTLKGNDLMNALYDSVFYKKRISQKKTIGLNNQTLNELINDEISLRLRIVSDTTTFASVKNKASNLIEFLEKEYHLE
jgi:hypothetical protein